MKLCFRLIADPGLQLHTVHQIEVTSEIEVQTDARVFLLNSDEIESMSTVLSLGAEFQVLENHGLKPVVTNFLAMT